MMRPALYQWKNMVRDYVRLLVDEKWQWCSQCRRPVEHIDMLTLEDGPDGLTCLDCGFSDSEVLRSIPWQPGSGL